MFALIGSPTVETSEDSGEKRPANGSGAVLAETKTPERQDSSGDVDLTGESGTSAREAEVTMRTARPAIIQGFVASTLLLVASFGVGWLSQSSRALVTNPAVMWMRFEVPGVIFSIVLLVIGGMLLIRSWLRLGSRLGDFSAPGALKAVRVAIIAWTAPLLFSLPLFSRDVFAYIAQGLMVTNGLNPYEDTYSTITGYLQIGADDMWSQSPTPYGPVWLWLESWVVYLGGADPLLSSMLFRVLALIGMVLMWWGIAKMAAIHKVNVARAEFLAVANPLVLTTFIASIHNDSLMMGFVMLGLYLVARKYPILGIVAITASIGVKPITLLLLPFVGLMWAGKGASFWRRMTFAALAMIISFAMMAVLGYIVGGGFGWVSALKTPGSVWIWYAPVGFIGMVVALIGEGLGLQGWALADVVYLLAKVAALVVVARVFFFGQDSRIIRRMAIALAAVVLCAPMIQAWYVVWLLPLFAVSGVRMDWQYKVWTFVTTFFVGYSLCDQLDIFPYLKGIDLTSARNLAGVLVIAFGVYLVALDTKTKHLYNLPLPALREIPSAMREMGRRTQDGYGVMRQRVAVLRKRLANRTNDTPPNKTSSH